MRGENRGGIVRRGQALAGNLGCVQLSTLANHDSVTLHPTPMLGHVLMSRVCPQHKAHLARRITAPSLFFDGERDRRRPLPCRRQTAGTRPADPPAGRGGRSQQRLSHAWQRLRPPVTAAAESCLATPSPPGPGRRCRARSPRRPPRRSAAPSVWSAQRERAALTSGRRRRRAEAGRSIIAEAGLLEPQLVAMVIAAGRAAALGDAQGCRVSPACLPAGEHEPVPAGVAAAVDGPLAGTGSSSVRGAGLPVWVVVPPRGVCAALAVPGVAGGAGERQTAFPPASCKIMIEISARRSASTGGRPCGCAGPATATATATAAGACLCGCRRLCSSAARTAADASRHRCPATRMTVMAVARTTGA